MNIFASHYSKCSYNESSDNKVLCNFQRSGHKLTHGHTEETDGLCLERLWGAAQSGSKTAEESVMAVRHTGRVERRGQWRQFRQREKHVPSQRRQHTHTTHPSCCVQGVKYFHIAGSVRNKDNETGGSGIQSE